MGVLTFAAASYVVRSVYQRLERRGVFDIDPDTADRPTAWIDGLRGISALGVVSSHLSTCIAMYMAEACCWNVETGMPSLFQLPPLRILAAGPSWLAMFFLLSGLSSSLAPIRLARSGRVEQAYTGLGRSALKRPLRIVLPASAATVVSWALCQAHTYLPARHMGVFLLSTDAPPPAKGPLAALVGLFRSLFRTWTWLGPDNEYEHAQYALVSMLFGSYLVYGVLLATVAMKPRARILTVLVLMLLSFDWSWRLIDPQTSLPYLGGVLLAELWNSGGSDSDDGNGGARQALEAAGKVVGPVLMFLGVLFMSWAKGGAEKLWWSRNIKEIIVASLPRARDPERVMGSIGAFMVVMAVMAVPRLRRMLSRPFVLWLGRVSFAIYLVHSMVMRLAMPWLFYIGNPFAAIWYISDMDSTEFKALVGRPGIVRKVLATTILYGLILTAAQVWTRKFEPRVEKLTRRIEELVIMDDVSLLARDRSTPGGNGTLPEHNKSKPV